MTELNSTVPSEIMAYLVFRKHVRYKWPMVCVCVGGPHARAHTHVPIVGTCV